MWNIVYRIRRFLYLHGFFHQYHFKVPIISVGNLSFGGTGKTPFILWLAQIFEEKNFKVMILTRGYKGEMEHSSGVLESSKKLGLNPSLYGDEAVLLARNLKSSVVVVGKNRSSNLIFYFDKYRPDVVLLDDGHQHLKIARNLDIVLFDTQMSIDKYENPPLGYLREGISALRTTDAIIYGRVGEDSHEQLGKLKNLIQHECRKDAVYAETFYRAHKFYNAQYEAVCNVEEMAGKNVIALAAIGSPEHFFTTLEALKVNIVEKVFYADHHYFKEEEVRPLLEKAYQEDAYLVITEKDMVKLRKVIMDDRVVYLGIELAFRSGEEELKELIFKTCDFSRAL